MPVQSKKRFVRSSVLLPALVATVLLLSACSSSTAADDSLLEMDRAVDEKSSEVSIFYPSADIIAEETVVLDEGDSLPLAAMRELFRAQPKDPELRATLPAATVNSVKIADGVAWVDFDRKVLVEGEDKQTQQVALAAIIYTLKQFDGVKKVAFSVEGKTDGVLDGKDVASFWGHVNLKDQPWSVSTKRTSEEGRKVE